MKMKFFAIEMPTFLAHVIVSAAQLNIDRLIELLCEKIIGLYFSDASTVECFHRAFAYATCSGKYNFNRRKFYLSQFEFEVVYIKTFMRSADSIIPIPLSIGP